MLFSLNTSVVTVPAARYGGGTKFEEFEKFRKLKKYGKFKSVSQ
jgi:hypothetical protein